MTDVQKLTNDELGDAVDHVPLTAIDEYHPVIKEWIDRRRARRINLQMSTSEVEDRGAVIGLREARLKRVNQVTRAEALRISQQILKDAECGRIEVAEREANQGTTDIECIREIADHICQFKIELVGFLDSVHNSVGCDLSDVRVQLFRIANALEGKVAPLIMEAPNEDEATPQSGDE